MRVQTVGAVLFPTGYVDTDSALVAEESPRLEDYDPVIMTMTGDVIQSAAPRPTLSPAALILIGLVLMVLASKRS